MPFDLAARFRRLALLFSALLAFAAAAHAEPPTPTQREIWVPTEQLAEVLAQYPRAVLLSREQYDTLLRDATARAPKPPAPPQDAALTSSTYTAHVDGESLLIDGDLTIEVLTDSWAQVPLAFASVILGEIQIDGEAALQPAPVNALQSGPASVNLWMGRRITLSGNQNAQPNPNPSGLPAMLLLRGRGTHHLKLSLTTPITATESHSSRVDFQLPHAGAASLLLNLPPHTRVESKLPVHLEEAPDAARATVALAPSFPGIALEWFHTLDETPGSLPLSYELSTPEFLVDTDTVRLVTEVEVSSARGDLPTSLEFTAPPNATILDVNAWAGHWPIPTWTAETGRLHVTLPPGHRNRTFFDIEMQQPSLAGADRAKISLTLPALVGAGRTHASLRVAEMGGVAVRQVLTSATPIDFSSMGTYPGSHLIGAWESADIPAVDIIVERLKPRFNADLDTLVEFKPEAVFIERTLSLHSEEGRLFNVTAAIPAGEELLSVKSGELEPDWRLEGEKRDRLVVRWSGEKEAAPPKESPIEIVTPPLPRVVTFRTRLEPKGWNALGPDGLTVALHDAKIEGVDHVSGYLALRADPDFRLEASAPDSLELRDGRTTPIHGDYAWFRREEMILGIKVMRRPAEITANLRGYALPLAGVLDLHAQIAWLFRHSGVRSVQVKTPAAVAAQFHFDGPQIAERTLVGDTWTITFQKEITGSYALAVTAQIPVAKLPEDPSRFQTEVPLIELPNAQHVTGTWAVEANTDTEITLAAEGMNELDAQLAPGFQGYQPRHRVIGAFSWLGNHYALRLEGVRHAPGKVLSTVADQMNLVSVVSPSGIVRTQAELKIRTISEQFLDLTLPPAAKLLSLSLNDEAIKPVQGEPGNVRVQLATGAASNIPAAIVVLYETDAGAEWSAEGKGALSALHLPPQVPVLHSEWRVYLPDGFYYDRVKSNLEKAEEPHPLPLLFAPWRALQSDILYFAWTGLLPQFRRSQAAAPLQNRNGMVYFGYGGSSTPAPTTMGQVRPVGSPASFQAETAWDRPLHGSESTPGSRLETARTDQLLQRKLNAIIIPRLQLREATAEEAISFLENKSSALDLSEGDPSRRGLKIEITSAARPVVTGPNAPRITVDLDNIPLGEALKYVTGLSNLVYRIEQGQVKILPIGSLNDTLLTKEWIVPPEFLTSPVTSSEPKGSSVKAKDYLTASGVTFPPGASATFLAQSSTLVVKNTQENLDLITSIVDAAIESMSPKQRDRWLRRTHQLKDRDQLNDDGAMDQPQAHPSLRLQRKLEQIILPKLELHEATVRQAIDYLQQQSVAYDRSMESDPSYRGVKIVLKLDVEETPAPAQAPGVPRAEVTNSALITVSLTNIPLGEALKYITGLSNLKYKLEENVILIVPVGPPTDTLVTKEWKIPPGFLKGAPTSGPEGTTPAGRVEAKDYLTALGVTFPPGASAIYLPDSAKLIVKNTRENIDLIEATTEAAVMNPPPTLYHSADEMQTVGLIPLDLDLPISGQEVNFHGLTNPDHVTFHFINEWTRARRLWLWFVVGAPAALLLAGRHPGWRTCWVILLCTAISICLSPASTTACNAFLLGWITARILRRLALWLTWPQSRKEVLA